MPLHSPPETVVPKCPRMASCADPFAGSGDGNGGEMPREISPHPIGGIGSDILCAIVRKGVVGWDLVWAVSVRKLAHDFNSLVKLLLQH